jgi:arsenite methyltransferase
MNYMQDRLISKNNRKKMSSSSDDNVRKIVRQNYKLIATLEDGGCGCGSSSCCSGSGNLNPEDVSLDLGYSNEDLKSVPEGANLGLGCGNPQAIASLKPGEVVLDLGSGGGFDCFLAERQVGESGRVIGVDMTPEMISKARANAEKGGFRNVEFRLGEIENLPVADNSMDVIISNCVINLSPDKQRVFNEAFRVLKPGGRLAVSDVVASAELPDNIRKDMALYSGCIAGASLIADVEKMLHAAGFEKISVTPKDESKTFIRDWAPGIPITDYIVSANIEAQKPKA